MNITWSVHLIFLHLTALMTFESYSLWLIIIRISPSSCYVRLCIFLTYSVKLFVWLSARKCKLICVAGYRLFFSLNLSAVPSIFTCSKWTPGSARNSKSPIESLCTLNLRTRLNQISGCSDVLWFYSASLEFPLCTGLYLVIYHTASLQITSHHLKHLFLPFDVI